MNINKWTMEVEAYLKLYVRLRSLCTVHHISHVPQTDNNIDQLLLRMYCLVSKRNSQHTNFISFIISPPGDFPPTNSTHNSQYDI